MKNILFLFILFLPWLIISQKHDYVWLLGYGYSLEPNDTFGISVIDFNTPSLNPKIYFDKEIKYDYSGTSVCMSDENGKYIFTTDGNTILSYNNNFMKDGNNISPPDNLHSELDPQSCIVLPLSDNINYFLVNNQIEIIGTSISAIHHYFSIINMNEDNGLGKVVKKLISFSQDTLELSKITATRHANGKDWWLLIPGYNTDFVHTFLIKDTTISLIYKQKVDSIIYSGWGQAIFSPNGAYYANISSVSQSSGTHIYLMSFDRCSGEMHLIKYHHIFPSPGNIGLSFSPDSKTLYVGFGSRLFRVDLNSTSKSLDTAALNDDYIEDIGGGFRRYNPFGFMQLAPDGRIYCTPTTESRNFLVIHHPNLQNALADIRQHSLHIASLKRTLPMHPNFRLGPLDGSPCDTLGIDNIPVAEFRYDQDTGQYLRMEFTDLSHHEPKEWYWNFGDPNSLDNTNNQNNPSHIFSGNGIYKVCLIVKNERGSDTICKFIFIGTVGVENKEDFLPDITFSPNPFSDYFVVNVLDYLPQKMVLQFYNSLGELVLIRKLYQGSNFINLEDLEAGVYFISVIENGKLIVTDKLIKI